MKINEKLLNELVNTIKDKLIRDEDCANNAITKVRTRLNDLEKLKDFHDQDTFMHLNAIIDDLNGFRWYWDTVMERVMTLRNSVHTIRDPHNPVFECYGEARVKQELEEREKYHGKPQPVACGAVSSASIEGAVPRPPFRA